MNNPHIMDGPADLWHFAGVEWRDGALSKPLFVRAAYRKGEPADGFTQLRDQVADVLDSFHPMDLYPVRVLVRALRKMDYHLFGAGEHREVEWLTGAIIAACVCVVAFGILRSHH